MSITIKAIAQRTGLSIPTVGNVLGRSAARYSATTRQRVFDAARELGYRPNSSARAMRQGKIGCAALVLSRSHQSTHSHVPTGLLDGLDDELSQHNMHLAVTRLSDEQLSNEDFVPKVLREYMADGMIVNYTHEIPERMLELIHAHHTPAVWLNAKLPLDCVYPDDLNGAAAATEALISRGHRRIALIHLISPEVFSGSFEQAQRSFHYSVADRAGGYSRAMLAAGLTPIMAHNDRFVPERESIQTVRQLLSGEDRPTALLLYSENDVTSVLAAAASLGLSVPKDLAVMCFYPAELKVAGMNWATVPIPTVELGRRAVRMLLKRIETPDQHCTSEAVPYELPKVETIAPPAK